MGKKACEKCRLACSLLHSSIGTTSALHTSAKRDGLKTMEAKISFMQDLLFDVTQKLAQMKQELNRQNDGFVHRFPLEITSQIFTKFVKSSDLHYVKSGSAKRYQWMPVLILGGVCRSWRGATLAMPQLWAEFTINPSKDALPEWLVVTSEWLDRSRTRGFPLSLTIKGPNDKTDERSSFPASSPTSLIQLIRSHSRRWKRLVVESTSEIINELLVGVEDLPPTGIDSLSVHPPQANFGMALRLALEDNLLPNTLSVRHVFVSKMPSCWHRLTCFEAVDIFIGQVLHILENAVNLENCSILDVQKSWDPPSTKTIVHNSLTSLIANTSDFDANFLRYLTLPSLKNFNYISRRFCPGIRVRGRDITERDTKILTKFIDRSEVSSLNFTLEVQGELDERFEDWHSQVQCITVLKYTAFKERETRKLLKALTSSNKPLLFPSLRDLHITAHRTSHQCWSLICDLLDVKTQSRTLQSLSITLKLERPVKNHVKLMYPYVHRRLCAIRESGKKISAVDAYGNDILAASAMRNGAVDEDEDDSSGDDEENENDESSEERDGFGEDDDDEQDENDYSDEDSEDRYNYYG